MDKDDRAGLAAVRQRRRHGCGTSAPHQELAGVWQGKLPIDATTSLTIQFTFAKDAKGGYTAVLNSPDNGAIKNTPATGVTWDGSNVKLQVAALSGSYAGALEGRQDQRPVDPAGRRAAAGAESVPEAGDVQGRDGCARRHLAGQRRSCRGRPVGTLFQFKKNAKGELVATFGIPDQGLTDSPGHQCRIRWQQAEPQHSAAQGGYSATLASGQFTGN